MLAAVAVVLSLVERMFPLDAIVPVPGVKLGLANVVTLFALTRLSARDAFAIVVTRVAISSLLMGSCLLYTSLDSSGKSFCSLAAHRLQKSSYNSGFSRICCLKPQIWVKYPFCAPPNSAGRRCV